MCAAGRRQRLQPTAQISHPQAVLTHKITRGPATAVARGEWLTVSCRYPTVTQLRHVSS